MQNQRNIPKKYVIEIVILSVAILLAGASLLLAIPDPVIVMNGEKSVTVDVNTEYRDAGAEVRFMFFDISGVLQSQNGVNTARPGRYEVVYTAEYMLGTAREVRYVEVVDRVRPVVTLLGDTEMRVEDISQFVDPGATAADNCDGDVTARIARSHTETVFTEGERRGETEYVFTYSVLDSSGNAAFATRKVVTKDETPPVITLNGEEFVYVVRGQPYEEQGATAEDNVSGTVEVAVSGEVDTDVSGSYAVKYTAEDAAGNTASVTRTVKVREPVSAAKQGETLKAGGSYVALTFDDGPSANTAAVLDMLKKYNVKGTFFILNYDEDQIPVLKRIVNEGHTLAIHSYSHTYSSIYTSTDAYMQGVYKLQDKIFQDTGYTATILRFPGGSSNTVSKNYCTGVMTALAKRVEAEGYAYFDWNVDSGDADGYCVAKDTIVKNVANGLKQGRVNVVLMHDASPKTTTPEALDEIISAAQAKGYTFIPLSGSVPAVHHSINN